MKGQELELILHKKKKYTAHETAVCRNPHST